MSAELSKKLENYLKEQYPNKRIQEVFDLKQLSSGWAGEVYSFSISLETQAGLINENYIFKAYSACASAVNSIVKEYKALEFLYGTGYPVPKPLLHSTDTTPFGNPFLIMEQIKGKLLFESYTNAPDDQKDSILRSFAQLLYRLHSINVKEIEPGFDNESHNLLDIELCEIETLMNQHKITGLEEIFNWLVVNKNTVYDLKPSILHRDYHPWNVIEDDSGRHYVIDWVWSIGDSRFDLAWTISLMERSGFEDFAKKVLTEYKLMCGGNINNLEYFKVLATLRWILNVTTSVKTGDNLRESDLESFRNFLKHLVDNALIMFKEITGIQIEFSI